MPRLVMRTPLAELWDDAGPVVANRVRDLTATDIRALLRTGPVRFAVATIAAPLCWVRVEDCYQFWKGEVQSRVADPDGAYLEEFPGGYCYFGSLWEPVGGLPVVLLTTAH